MQPVVVFQMPHNYRDEIYNAGDGPSFCHYEPGEERRPAPIGGAAYVVLPIPMPQCAFVTTDDAGRVIGLYVDGRPVRWQDIDVVYTGIQQYNRDLSRSEAACREPRHGA